MLIVSVIDNVSLIESNEATSRRLHLKIKLTGIAVAYKKDKVTNQLL